MNNKIEQLLTDLCERSDAEKHTEFYFLTTWQDYRELKAERRYIKIFTKRLCKNSNYLFKSYCTGIRKQNANFDKILAYNNLEKLIQFCKDEIEIFNNIIYEYEAYLLEGNFLDALLGHPRSTEDLRDFREEL